MMNPRVFEKLKGGEEVKNGDCLLMQIGKSAVDHYRRRVDQPEAQKSAEVLEEKADAGTPWEEAALPLMCSEDFRASLIPVIQAACEKHAKAITAERDGVRATLELVTKAKNTRIAELEAALDGASDVTLKACEEQNRLKADRDELRRKVQGLQMQLSKANVKTEDKESAYKRWREIAEGAIKDRDTALAEAQQLEEELVVTNEEIAKLRVCFSEASQNAGPAFVAQYDDIDVMDPKMIREEGDEYYFREGWEPVIDEIGIPYSMSRFTTYEAKYRRPQKEQP